MGVVRTDDQVQALRGWWLEVAGSVWPWFLTFSYVTWGVISCVSFPLFIVSVVTGASIRDALTLSVLVGAIAALWAKAQMSRDRGLRGVLTIELAEIRCWWAQRRRNVERRSASKPVHVSLRKVIR